METLTLNFLPTSHPHLSASQNVMLPTPSTSHVNIDRIYEPAEDSFLFLDTLSAESETLFLKQRFNAPASAEHLNPDPCPIILEVGTGSGVILAFVTAHARAIFGRNDILTLGADVNEHACRAAQRTTLQACEEALQEPAASATLLGTLTADLTSPLRCGTIDVLIFNPPYVPSSSVPIIRELERGPDHDDGCDTKSGAESSEYDSHLLSLSYEGGMDGMEVTHRLLVQIPLILSERGIAYVLLCQQNQPETVKQMVKNWRDGWQVETVRRSGNSAGWEKLQVIRIWKESKS